MTSTSVAVTCGECGVATTVPFVPTPGRPVYCRECFAKKAPTGGPGGRGGPGGPRGGPGGPRGGMRFREENTLNRTAPRKRMLSQGRKGHFVYDVMDILERGGTMPENERRVFVESLFTRGARQSSQAAYDFLVEKHAEKLLTDEEAKRIQRILEQYSFYR